MKIIFWGLLFVFTVWVWLTLVLVYLEFEKPCDLKDENTLHIIRICSVNVFVFVLPIIFSGMVVVVITKVVKSVKILKKYLE